MGVIVAGCRKVALVRFLFRLRKGYWDIGGPSRVSLKRLLKFTVFMSI